MTLKHFVSSLFTLLLAVFFPHYLARFRATA